MRRRYSDDSPWMVLQTIILTLLGLATLGTLVWASAAQAAGPEVGDTIVNQGSVTYKDSVGLEHIATTNEVVLVVQQVFSATIEEDRELLAVPGQTVLFYHTLTNTGNGPDTFQLQARDNSAGGPDSGNYDVINVYVDENRNGQIDNGEIVIASSLTDGTVTIDGGEEVLLIVAADVPATATDGDFYDLTLTAQAFQGGSSVVANSVEDLTNNNGRDGADDTNEDRARVTEEAVLEVFKASSLDDKGTADPDDDQITYTVTIRNIGLINARDIIVTDELPAETVFFAGSITTADDFVGGAGDDGANGADGSVPTHNAGMLTGEIDVLPAAPGDNEVSFSYVVDLVPGLAADTEIRNIATADGDLDEDPNTDEDPVDSNETLDKVQRQYGVEITDTGLAAANGVNDGGDDDNTADDIQFVDQVAQGETVVFTHIVTNQGNVDDSFYVDVIADDFPPGTVWRFFYEDGATPLIDNNQDGHPDTGLLSPNEQITIIAKAVLPADQGVATPVSATLRATSEGDPDLPPVSDDTQERLGLTGNPGVDIANSSSADGFGDPAENADPASSITTTTAMGATDEDVVFPLFVVNEGGFPEAYTLSAWADAAGSADLPSGWRVQFETLDGNPITATPTLAPGLANAFAFQARVFVPFNVPLNTPLSVFFKVDGTNSGSTDIKQDAVTRGEVEGITLTPDGEGTVAPCATIDYDHEVENVGNTAEDILITVFDQTELQHVLLFPVEVTAGAPDNYLPVQERAVGDLVAVFDAASGQWVTRALTDGGGRVAIPLDPDDRFRFKIRVLASCETPAQTIDVVQVRAEVVDGTSQAERHDVTTVSSVALEITKAGALDANCDSNPDGGDSSFAVAGVIAAPGDCVIWRLQITNEGADTACNVTIYDSAPSFTTLHGVTPGEPTIISEPAPGGGSCTSDDPNIQCGVGPSLDITGDGSPEAHCLKAGEQAEVRFRVRID